MSKFITNYAAVKEFVSSGSPAAVITEIKTPYGKGHRLASGGDNWQWINVNFNSFSNSGVLRFIARSSENIELSIQ